MFGAVWGPVEWLNDHWVTNRITMQTLDNISVITSDDIVKSNVL